MATEDSPEIPCKKAIGPMNMGTDCYKKNSKLREIIEPDLSPFTRSEKRVPGQGLRRGGNKYFRLLDAGNGTSR
jgi:hypothetical protein